MDHVERRHSIVLAGSLERVFPLFTPAGEKLWVEGWDPEFLHPTSGETCQGGRSFLAQMTKEAFATMIEDWRTHIDRWLARSQETAN